MLRPVIRKTFGFLTSFALNEFFEFEVKTYLYDIKLCPLVNLYKRNVKYLSNMLVHADCILGSKKGY